MDQPRMRDPRNQDDFDTWEYGTEPLPGDRTWTKQAGTAPHRPEGELVVLPAEAFDALASRLEQPGHYDPRVARVLSRKAPWE